jgi:hypothetical protein
MKTIKAILVTAAIIFGSIVYAQPQGGRQQGGQQGPRPIPNEKQIKEMVSDLAKNISLTSTQEASVLKLYTEHFETVKEKTSGTSKPKREEMDALKSDFEKSVKALLTTEQQKGYEAYLKKREMNQPQRE